MKLNTPNYTTFQLDPCDHNFRAIVYHADVQACDHEKFNGNTKNKMQIFHDKEETKLNPI